MHACRSAPRAFSSRWLVHRLDRLLAAHSKLEVRLVHTVMHTDLGRDSIDLAIRWGDGMQAALNGQGIALGRMALIRDDLSKATSSSGSIDVSGMVTEAGSAFKKQTARS